VNTLAHADDDTSDSSLANGNRRIFPSPPWGDCLQRFTFLPFAPLGEKVAEGRMRGHSAWLEKKTLIRPAATFSRGEKAYSGRLVNYAGLSKYSHPYTFSQEEWVRVREAPSQLHHSL
jgi:hypothetical protein